MQAYRQWKINLLKAKNAKAWTNEDIELYRETLQNTYLHKLAAESEKRNKNLTYILPKNKQLTLF